MRGSKGSRWRLVLINMMVFLLPPLVHAETQGNELVTGTSEIVSSVQVPPQVFVGDTARLVLTMVPKASIVGRSIVIDVLDKLPQSRAVQISRLELDAHGKNPTIIVDFIPFEPGRIQLPPLEIGPYLISRQEVEVASVLESEETGWEMAPLEEPLLVPGSRLLLYGTILLVVLLAALLLAGSLWGRSWYGMLRSWLWKQRSMRELRRSLDRLEQVEQVSPRDIGLLIARLRTYMELQTGFPCQAKTGQELAAQAGTYSRPELVLNLGRIVTLSDTLRFSGRKVAPRDLVQLCSETKKLLLLIHSKPVSLELSGNAGSRVEN